MDETKICNRKTEVFSRVVGYFRPVNNWNEGKKEEFNERKEFTETKSMHNKLINDNQNESIELNQDETLKEKIMKNFA